MTTYPICTYHFHPEVLRRAFGWTNLVRSTHAACAVCGGIREDIFDLQADDLAERA